MAKYSACMLSPVAVRSMSAGLRSKQGAGIRLQALARARSRNRQHGQQQNVGQRSEHIGQALNVSQVLNVGIN